MFKRILLTREEKRVIKKITKVQIKNLQKILNKDCYEDITLFTLQKGIDERDFMRAVTNGLNTFKNIQLNPSEMFDLQEDDLSIAKHIMFNFVTHSKYKVGKRRVWRKLMLIDMLPISLQ